MNSWLQKTCEEMNKMFCNCYSAMDAVIKLKDFVCEALMRMLGIVEDQQEDIYNLASNIDSNRDQIMFLASQFEDGATGQVIDGGFFTETGIKRNYNGGVW